MSFFSKYRDNYCRYQYCANDTLFRNISRILRSIFQDFLPKKKDVTFCETTDTYIKQIQLSCLYRKRSISEPMSNLLPNDYILEAF